MKTIPSFNFDITEKDDIHKICLNGLYIGRVYKYYGNNSYQFVPKGFNCSFVKNHMTLKSFENPENTFNYVKQVIVKTYKKTGRLI